MNTTLCLRLIWILPIATLLTGCAGATATSRSFENDTDDSVPARLLPEEPSSTEGRQGSFQAIATKSGASPPEERTPPISPAISIVESVVETMKPLAEGSTSAMVHATTATSTLQQWWIKQEVDQIMSMLWSSFVWHHHLPKYSPTIDRLDSYLQDLLRPQFLEFVRSDPQRSEQWMKWLNFKAGTEEALVKEELTPAFVQEVTETTTNVLSDPSAMEKIQDLWKEFERVLPMVKEDGFILKKEHVFLTFVSLDPVRQADYNEWRKWRITNFGTNGPEFTKEMVIIPTEKKAADIEKKLFNDFLQQEGSSRGMPGLHEYTPHMYELLQELQPELLPELRAKFVVYVHENHERSVEWMQLENLRAYATDVKASIKFTSSPKAKVMAGLYRSIMWSEFRQSWLEKKPNSHVPLTYDRLDPVQKRDLDRPFLQYVLKLRKRRRKKLIDASAEITQPEITQPAVIVANTSNNSRKRPRDSSNSPS